MRANDFFKKRVDNIIGCLNKRQVCEDVDAPIHETIFAAEVAYDPDTSDLFRQLGGLMRDCVFCRCLHRHHDHHPDDRRWLPFLICHTPYHADYGFDGAADDSDTSTDHCGHRAADQGCDRVSRLTLFAFPVWVNWGRNFHQRDS